MAASMIRACIRMINLLEQRSQSIVKCPIHTSCLLYEKKDDDSKLSLNRSKKPGNESDKLLDAAAEVASTMRGLEEQAFKDLANQLEKLQTPKSSPQEALTKPPVIAELLRKTESEDSTDLQTKHRMDSIVERYKPHKVPSSSETESKTPNKPDKANESNIPDRESKSLPSLDELYSNLTVSKSQKARRKEKNIQSSEGVQSSKQRQPSRSLDKLKEYAYQKYNEAGEPKQQNKTKKKSKDSSTTADQTRKELPTPPISSPATGTSQPRHQTAPREAKRSQMFPGDNRRAPPSSGEGRQTLSSSGAGRQTSPSSGVGRQAPPSLGMGRQAPPSSGMGRQAPPSSGMGRQAPPSSGMGRRTQPPSHDRRDPFSSEGNLTQAVLRTRRLGTASVDRNGRMYDSDMLAASAPLQIFNPSKWCDENLGNPIPMLETWRDFYAEEVSRAEAAPNNGFEEAIKLTKEGKLWQFPIDNEQGMEVEKATPFYEHVFLEKHLNAFPQSGPVRRFMELVIMGLGKNPHLTVAEKVEHINWYEDYFRKKQPLVPSETLINQTEV